MGAGATLCSHRLTSSTIYFFIMNTSLILLDVSLTGGRGPAKKAYELIADLRANNIPFKVITDRMFASKLRDMGIEPEYVVDTDLTDAPATVIQKFEEVMRTINYSLLVKMGARVAGPIAARKMGKPYILVDGGLPDYLTEEESLYERITFEQAERVFVTTQFPWEYPNRTGLTNVAVCGFPLSGQTFERVEKLKAMDKLALLESVSSELIGDKPRTESDMLINLLMTGDIFELKNRVTYGGWLTAQQYDQCVGFVRRFVTDLGEQLQGQDAFLFIDREVRECVQDIVIKYPRIKLITFAKDWDFEAEIVMQAAADVIVSRATNYQPFVAALEKGCSVTTPVPANGYMDEDSAGLQYQALGFTKLITYDDEQYMKKLLAFVINESAQNSISTNLQKATLFLKERGLYQEVVQLWQKQNA